MNNRNVNLDLIKSLACIGVVGLHSVGMVNYSIYYFCTFAVPFFFMANGYLMFCKEKTGYGYALKKILGLAKIVIIYNLLIMIPVMVFRHKVINPITFSLKSLLQQGYLWHFWFFGALMIMYALLPIVHGLLSDRRSLHIIVLVILGSICIGFNIYSSLTGYPIQAFVPQSLRLWTWLFYFLMGGYLAKINIKDSITGRKRWILLFSVIILTVLANTMQKRLGLYFIHNRTAEFFYDDGVVMCWIVMAFILLLTVTVPAKMNKPIVLFSSVSLGIFIFHPLLLTAIGTVFTASFTWSAVLLWVAVTIISGGITFIIVKIPFTKWLVLV